MIIQSWAHETAMRGVAKALRSDIELDGALFHDEPYAKSLMADFANCLPDAHVLVIPEGQHKAAYKALLDSTQDNPEAMKEYGCTLRPPFPLTFVQLVDSASYALDRPIFGLLVEYHEDLAGHGPVTQVAPMSLWEFPESPGIEVRPEGLVEIRHDDAAVRLNLLEGSVKQLGREKAERWLADAVWDYLAVPFLLESANVGIEDLPVSRQVRRQMQRAGREPARFVTVRRSRLNTGRVTPTGLEANYTHQFEVAGHFKHHGEGTPVYRAAERDQPEKIVNMPGRGPCVRVWCPSFVKGPADTPLVPKIRRMNTDG